MTRTYDIEQPFEELSRVAGWWQLRPTDEGDGKGYSGMALTVKQKGNPQAEPVEFQGTDLDLLIRQGVAWCDTRTAIVQPKHQAKRVIPRS